LIHSLKKTGSHLTIDFKNRTPYRITLILQNQLRHFHISQNKLFPNHCRQISVPSVPSVVKKPLPFAVAVAVAVAVKFRVFRAFRG
jgi:hypothetical protein